MLRTARKGSDREQGVIWDTERFCSKEQLFKLGWLNVISSGLLTPVLRGVACSPRSQRVPQYGLVHIPRLFQQGRSFDGRELSGSPCIQAMAKRKADTEQEKPKKKPAQKSKSNKAQAEQEQEGGGLFASGDLVTPATRVRQLKSGTPGKGPVIYWCGSYPILQSGGIEPCQPKRSQPCFRTNTAGFGQLHDACHMLGLQDVP